MIAQRCSYNKHFVATANDKVYKRYFNNLTILLFNTIIHYFYFHARDEAARHR